jgi:mono/diheme cytochrome c family protein
VGDAPANPPPAANAGNATPAAAAPAAGESRADLLAHGKYLVETIAGCGNCHTPHNQDGSLDLAQSYAGAYVITEPIFEAYAPNITPDMETGIGSWSEEDIVHAVRNGIRPDGQVLGPPMSFAWYRNLSDRDVRAIAAFIKQVPAIRNEVPRSTYQIPLNGYGPIVTTVPEVPRTDLVKYGEYLAGPVGHCMDCHTPLVEGRNDLAQIGRGANIFVNPFRLGWTAIAANITPHPTDGIGAWTDEENKRAIPDGVSRNGRQLLPFMPFGLYKNIREEDLDAVVAYLRSLPPLTAAPPPAEGEAAAD